MGYKPMGPEQAKKMLELATGYYSRKETYTIKEIFGQIEGKLEENQKPAYGLEKKITAMIAFANLRLVNIEVEAVDCGETWGSRPCLRKEKGKYRWDIISYVVNE